MRDVWVYWRVMLEDLCSSRLWSAPSDTEESCRVGKLTGRVMIRAFDGRWVPRFPEAGSSWLHKAGVFKAVVIGVYVPDHRLSNWDMPEVLYEDQFGNLSVMPIYCWDRHFKRNPRVV